VDRKRAVELLPETYAEALRLQEAGMTEAIPERLGITPEAVGPLLQLARAKLAALVETGDEPGS
jgi:DNA-directed RNA polymerase specialized sigma24 family protein